MKEKAVEQVGQTKRVNEPRSRSWSRREGVVSHPLFRNRGKRLETWVGGGKRPAERNIAVVTTMLERSIARWSACMARKARSRPGLRQSSGQKAVKSSVRTSRKWPPLRHPLAIIYKNRKLTKKNFTTKKYCNKFD